MGQKVHPYILRIGFGKDWLSKWFPLNKKQLADFLEEDVRIRDIVKKSYPTGSISKIYIERVLPTVIKIRIRTSRPGIIIGRKGQEREKIRQQLIDLTKKEVRIEVEEVENPAVEAQLVAELIAFQIIKRVNYRKAIKKALQQAESYNCEGVRIRVSGRLEGAEIARSEIYKYGKIPLHTFSADIDYGFAFARATYGTIGIKVWIYKGYKPLGSYLNKETDVKEKEVEVEE